MSASRIPLPLTISSSARSLHHTHDCDWKSSCIPTLYGMVRFSSLCWFTLEWNSFHPCSPHGVSRQRAHSVDGYWQVMMYYCLDVSVPRYIFYVISEGKEYIWTRYVRSQPF